MIAAATLQQEMGVTIFVWVSFLVVWIILASRGNDTASESPSVKTTRDRSTSSGTTTRTSIVISAPMPARNNRRRERIAALDDFDRPF